ncbi:unnamed protein product [Cylindrotheca closterium]|uniref:Saccharopine dehydrogenase NADP binding domain-containing protein n=1 Tax=Cylindrotheca closterium TaxID=2856 RepID=A0AAD2FPI8_9STRA|nr:unnamed protein product [Cylindrotheca closterium]
MAPSASDRPFDFIVYGATGYTGKKVAQYVVQQHASLSIAIAGRSKDKLLAVAQELGLPESSVLVASLPSSDTITTTADDNEKTKDQLVQVLSQAKIVLACAGPYRQCGMPLVQAAVEAKTDYLDLCGEPQFFDDTLLECDEAAKTQKVLVVSACAFDCVPAELSTCLVSKELLKKYPGTQVAGVEVCHTFEGLSKANATTFHAAVDGFHAASKGDLKSSRKKVTEKFGITKPPKRPDDWPKVPEQPGNLPTYHKATDTYILKFPGADAAAIMASWRYLRLQQPDTYKDRPNPRLSVCFGVQSQMTGYKVIGMGAIFSGLASTSFGCNMLHSNPGLFSNGLFVEGEGPSDADLEGVSFCTHTTGYGSGSKEEMVKVTCKGPEPGYVATPRMLVALGLTVLNHRDKLAFSGGVVLPGALFGETTEVYESLKENGITIEVVGDETK